VGRRLALQIMAEMAGSGEAQVEIPDLSVMGQETQSQDLVM